MPTADIAITLTPQGVLVPCGPVGAGETDLEEAFAQHETLGLLALARQDIPAGADPSLRYWRAFAHAWLGAICRLPETGVLTADAVGLPDETTVTEWVLTAPPMRGAEYLSPDLLRTAWRRHLEWAVEEAKALGGLGAFLEAYASTWSRVGRVTLHLAENKNDPEFPFAFMATYADGLDANGRLRRVPLGRSLQQSAGEADKAGLIRLLAPLHRASKESPFMADLVESGDVFHPIAWTAEETYVFLREIPMYETCGLLVLLPDWWKKRRRPRVSVTLDSQSKGIVGLSALMDFHLGVTVGGEALSRAEIEEILRAETGLVRIKGDWVEVDAERLQEALDHWEEVRKEVGANGISFVKGMRMLAGAEADLGRADETETHTDWSLVGAGEHLRETLLHLRSPADLAGPQPEDLQATLRPYQLDGLNWLWLCGQLGLGCCLADDMGLGKTIQVLATLLRHKPHRKAPSLLVVPASLLGNWNDEAARFAPALKRFTAHTSVTPRARLDEVAADPAVCLADTDLVITTYGMATRLDWLAAEDWVWDWLVLDEAQAIKNPGARQTKAIKTLRASTRVALTGTPVENRLGDLWSLFDFINPGLLGTATRFRAFVKDLEKRPDTPYAPLRKLTAPYILRRMKTDPTIAPDLPDKTEVDVHCGLAKAQAKLYVQGVTELENALAAAKKTKDSGIKRRGLVLSFLMRFKQVCNHPSQVTGDGIYKPTDSGKFARLEALCAEIASRGEKVLIFTQFRELTAPLAAFLAPVFGGEGLVLHGGTRVAARRELVAHFQAPAGPSFFILSLKAGGTGLNLTAASHVIHFDRWWNPAVENQATDRAFRIGQKRNVLVHKFITQGTIEEKIDQLIRDKQELADAVLGAGAEKQLTEMSDSEIIDMVRLDIDRASL